MGRGFLLYGLATVASGTWAIAHAFITRRQFYNAVIYLTTAKLDILILGNIALVAALLFGKMLQKLFLGQLRGFEVENLVENGKYTITETCLALTTFRQDIDFLGVFLFGSLLFFKCFHWLLSSRIDHVGRTHGSHLCEHLRLVGLLVFLFACDYLHVSCIISSGAVFTMMSTGKATVPTIHLLFAFEFTMLLLSLAVLAVQYAILVIDTTCYDGQWELKPSLTFLVEFSSDLMRLFLYTTFFVIVGSYFGIPLHLIRELYVTFQTLRERVTNFLRYKRLIRNLNEQFPDATREQIAERADDQCIICREPMLSGKMLPCSHLFHFHCLRTWLERSNTCPICRAQIPDLHTEEAAPAEPPANPPVQVVENVAVPDPVNAPISALSEPGLAAYRSLLHRQTESIQNQIKFHTDRLKELAQELDQILNMQLQCDDIVSPPVAAEERRQDENAAAE